MIRVFTRWIPRLLYYCFFFIALKYTVRILPKTIRNCSSYGVRVSFFSLGILFRIISENKKKNGHAASSLWQNLAEIRIAVLMRIVVNLRVRKFILNLRCNTNSMQCKNNFIFNVQLNFFPDCKCFIYHNWCWKSVHILRVQYSKQIIYYYFYGVGTKLSIIISFKSRL